MKQPQKPFPSGRNLGSNKQLKFKHIMANTYTQIHIQAVFAVKHRDALILPEFEIDLHKYITGIVQNQGHKLLAIGGMPDHVHIFFGMRPNQSLSSLLQQIKGDSSAWINENKFGKHHFNYQEGFGAFSYGKSQVPQVINYVLNQKEHHRKETFLEEYLKFLHAFDIDYDPKYIFTEPK
jgi:putative transposase